MNSQDQTNPEKVKTAFIPGIAGQDGSYLAEFLLSKGYVVYGCDREGAIDHPNLAKCKTEIKIVDSNILDISSMKQTLDQIKPDEIYNMAAQSLVMDKDNTKTKALNVDAVQFMLTAIQQTNKNIKYFQPSSAAMFDPSISPQNENTACKPNNLYGQTKYEAHLMTRESRAKGVFAATGIFYNHESPRRSPMALVRKVTQTAARIKLGKETKLIMGSLDGKRDWGYAGDYVKVMWEILQQATPQDFLIGTGEMHTVKDAVETAFQHLNLDWKQYYQPDPRFMRKNDTSTPIADMTKAKTQLKWKPETTFKELIVMMVENDLMLENK